MLVTDFDAFAFAGSAGRGPSMWSKARLVDEIIYETQGSAQAGQSYLCSAAAADSFGMLTATGTADCSAAITLQDLPVNGYTGIWFPVHGSINLTVGGLHLAGIPQDPDANVPQVYRVPFDDMDMSVPTFATAAGAINQQSSIDWVAVYREDIEAPATLGLLLLALALLARRNNRTRACP